MKDVLTVAAFRAILTAAIVGAGAALAVWSSTDDLKTIIIAGLTPALGILAARFGVEGGYDASRPAAAPGETSVRTEPPLG